MRKCGLIIGSLATLFTTVAQGGFVVTTARAPITTGTFAGKDGVTLSIRNDGVGTTDPTFGADIIYYDTTVNAPGTVVNPRFYIRAWDGTIRNPNASLNTKADFGYQGFVPGDATRNGAVDIFDLNALLPRFNTTGNTWATGDFTGEGNTDIFDLNALLPNFNTTVTPGSYVRFGTGAQATTNFSLLFTPAENSQVYADGQTVTGFEAQALLIDPNTAGLADSVATSLAFAVVPTGQTVTFSGSAAGHFGPTVPFSITDGSGSLTSSALAAVPEPASLGLISLSALVLCRSRRSTKTV